jgi:hypothetical protein
MEAPVMNNVEGRGRDGMIFAAIVGLALAGAILFSALIAFLTVNTSQTTVPTSPPATTENGPPTPR